jgi:hypothetical protein
MDALKIAFETMIVGALAPPWLVLAMRFFFPDANTWLQHLPAFSGDQVRLTIVAVLVAASACCLGAAVARLGQDFFDDDDLPLSVTESSIRVSVYCDELQSGLVQAAVPFQATPRTILPSLQTGLAAFVTLMGHPPETASARFFRFRRAPFCLEFTFLLLGVAGCCLVWKGIEGSWKFGTGFWAALLPTAMVYAGWYWTEILYDRPVLYSYYAQTHGLLKLGP